MKKNAFAQSLSEYIVIFLAVALALAVTYRYVYRSINARLKQAQEKLSFQQKKLY